jgi:dihydroxyacetone kinase-like protein
MASRRLRVEGGLIQIMPAPANPRHSSIQPRTDVPDMHPQPNWSASGGRSNGGGSRGIASARVCAAMHAAAAALRANAAELGALDRALGDGDLGATAAQVAGALARYADTTEETDLGRLLAQAGVAVQRAVPSTMGALVAVALVRAGQAVLGQHIAGPDDLARMLWAADAGLRERGRVRPGDKTLIDVTHPAAQAFAAALRGGAALPEAAARMLAAARAGRDGVTGLRNRVGRASWLGAGSKGKADPGAALAVLVLEALAG